MESSANLNPPAQPMSTFERIIGTFTRPRAVFEANRERPNWLAPFLVLLIVALISAYFIYPIATAEQARRVSENDSIPAEQKARIMEQVQGEQTQARRFISLGLVVVGSFVVLVIVAGVLLFGANFLLGGNARFAHVLALYATTNLVDVPGAIIKVPLMLAKHSTTIPIGPAALLSPEALDSLGGLLLARLDLFALWRWVLLTLGLAIMARTTVRRAASFTVPLWVFWTIAAIVFHKVTQGLGGF
jgi:hypothetical protein